MGFKKGKLLSFPLLLENPDQVRSRGVGIAVATNLFSFYDFIVYVCNARSVL